MGFDARLETKAYEWENGCWAQEDAMAKREMKRSYKGYTIHVSKQPDCTGWSWFVTTRLNGGRVVRLYKGKTGTAREAGQAGRRCIDDQIRRYR
jgi:hypothetical protein